MLARLKPVGLWGQRLRLKISNSVDGDVLTGSTDLFGGVSGLVTSTNDHPFVTDRGGSGANLANPATLSDEANNPSPSVGIANGGDAKAPVNPVIASYRVVSAASAGAPIDSTSAPNPTLAVNAANPTNVEFTISGLPSDYSGTVTFTDSTGKADVVAVGGNGSYSANLSNLTDGTLTYVMTVSDPAGNVITVDPTTTLGLPPGVTLQPINGGPDYYANNGLTYAVDAGWDNPDFIPIGPWQEALNSQSEANIWKALGWNTAFNIDTNNVSIPVLDANGIALI